MPFMATGLRTRFRLGETVISPGGSLPEGAAHLHLLLFINAVEASLSADYGSRLIRSRRRRSLDGEKVVDALSAGISAPTKSL